MEAAIRRTAHRKIVHSPVDGQIADVTAGKFDRMDDIRIGREGTPHAV
jgi:hypothetical protein